MPPSRTTSYCPSLRLQTEDTSYLHFLCLQPQTRTAGPSSTMLHVQPYSHVPISLEKWIPLLCSEILTPTSSILFSNKQITPDHFTTHFEVHLSKSPKIRASSESKLLCGHQLRVAHAIKPFRCKLPHCQDAATAVCTRCDPALLYTSYCLVFSILTPFFVTHHERQDANRWKTRKSSWFFTPVCLEVCLTDECSRHRKSSAFSVLAPNVWSPSFRLCIKLSDSAQAFDHFWPSWECAPNTACARSTLLQGLEPRPEAMQDVGPIYTFPRFQLNKMNV